ncbi:WAP four-disulfide core domain protein 3 [Leuresthes tenuis]|uniref:WAP four-disulfide core domain protein 3 n=1 Tax=Leuresthes tenuis TaxID=355514 RepID=UPI003B50EDBA
MGTHGCMKGVLFFSFGVFVQSFMTFHDGHTKPGQCPPQIYGFPSQIGCDCDGDCPDDHKCCEFVCGSVCVPPIFLKAECPTKHWSIGTCVHACADDHHCPHGKKCCFNGCGYECMIPKIAGKPGNCGFPGFTCEKHCSDDSNCGGNEKCCHAFCGYTCKDPLRFQENVTQQAQGPSILCRSAGVSMETYWSLGSLLLVFGVFRHCSAVLSVKPGNCPTHFYHTPSISGCLSDGDCPENHKCCTFQSGSDCVPPVITKAECPSTDGLIGTCAEYCFNDSDCSGGYKCCSNGCGHQCTAPISVKPGACGHLMFSLTCGNRCSHDSDCSGERKCCKTFCGRTCTEPL